MVDNYYRDRKTNVVINSDLYTADSFLLTENGTVVKGSDISGYYGNTLLKDSGLESSNVVFRCLSEIGVYEIVDISCHNGDVYSLLIHWITVEDKLKREYEILAKKDKSDIYPEELDLKRNLFGQIVSTTHDVNKMITTLYENNPYYYNRGRLITTAESLIAEYSYMSNSAFEIFLTRNITHPVNTACVFEIGDWKSGANTGKYVLIWKRDQNDWKILFDSNY